VSSLGRLPDLGLAISRFGTFVTTHGQAGRVGISPENMLASSIRARFLETHSRHRRCPPTIAVEESMGNVSWDLIIGAYEFVRDRFLPPPRRWPLVGPYSLWRPLSRRATMPVVA